MVNKVTNRLMDGTMSRAWNTWQQTAQEDKQQARILRRHGTRWYHGGVMGMAEVKMSGGGLHLFGIISKP